MKRCNRRPDVPAPAAAAAYMLERGAGTHIQDVWALTSHGPQKRPRFAHKAVRRRGGFIYTKRTTQMSKKSLPARLLARGDEMGIR